jgi:hypothetical protein
VFFSGLTQLTTNLCGSCSGDTTTANKLRPRQQHVLLLLVLRPKLEAAYDLFRADFPPQCIHQLPQLAVTCAHTQHLR